MKKASKKRVIVSVVLAALLFAVAITAYAVSWHDSGRFSGTDYSGDYTATMDLTADHASASLSVSNYTGVAYAGGGAAITGRISTSDPYYFVPIDVSYGEDSCSRSYNSATDGRGNAFTAMNCIFRYMGFSITSHSL